MVENIEYYGIIVYHFETDGSLEFVNIIFLDAKMEKVLLNLQIPQSIIDQNEVYEEQNENDVKFNDIVALNNEESLKSRIKLNVKQEVK